MFVYVVICCHFFNLLVYINAYHFTYYQNLAPDCNKVPAPRQNYPVPNPTRFLGQGLDRPPELSKIKPHDLHFLGVAWYSQGVPDSPRRPARLYPNKVPYYIVTALSYTE